MGLKKSLGAHRVLALTGQGWGGVGIGELFTLGTQGLDPYVVVHEFLHTFNLDDEYIEALGDPDSRVNPGSQVYERLESICADHTPVANHFQVPSKIDPGRVA